MEEEQLITHCKAFAQQADALELKAFSDTEYRENGFVAEFNALFDNYGYGKQNRTISGLNFRNPPRYNNLTFAVKTRVEQTSKTRCQVTFWGEPQWRRIRFILDKRNKEWKLIRFETFIGISNQSKTLCEAIWRKHRL